MKYVHLFAIIAVLNACGAAEVSASGVGLRQYQPAKTVVTPVCYNCPTGECRSGTPCSGCRLKGFPGRDGATPPPCTADGSCTPNRATFGVHPTRWRRWPGDTDSTGPTLSEATEGDSLLTPFETPEPEEEDQHAPPPIEDDPGFEEADELPPLEIDLPPLPERQLDVPARPSGDEPPALPFGAAPSKSSMPSMVSEPASQDLPVFDEPTREPVRRSRGFRALPVSSPSKRHGVNAPPALPEGFTQQTAPRLPEALRRLPEMGRRPKMNRPSQMALSPSPRVAPSQRVDRAVRPVTAIEPLLLRADR